MRILCFVPHLNEDNVQHFIIRRVSGGVLYMTFTGLRFFWTFSLLKILSWIWLKLSHMFSICWNDRSWWPDFHPTNLCTCHSISPWGFSVCIDMHMGIYYAYCQWILGTGGHVSRWEYGYGKLFSLHIRTLIYTHTHTHFFFFYFQLEERVPFF